MSDAVHPTFGRILSGFSGETRAEKSQADASFEANAEHRERQVTSLKAQIELLTAERDEMVEVLAQVREFLDGQIDVVDGSYGEPAPNRAMQLATAIDNLIGEYL